MTKYLYHSQRLDFTGGLLATEEECSVIEEECSVIDVPASTLADMLRSGNIKRLESLISASHH